MLLNNKILLVEDSKSDRFLFSRYLLQLGYECDSFEHGRELIDNLSGYPSSVILLDIELPVMNGIDTAIYIREHFKESDQRFILIGLTSHDDPEIMDRIVESGFDDCLHKPLLKLDLDAKLRQYILVNYSNNNSNTATDTSNNHSNRIYSLEMFEADDPEFLQSIVEMFVTSTPDAIAEMKLAYDKLDWELLRQHAHKLKPHFNYFMITKAASALQEVEEYARRANGIDKLPGLLEYIEKSGLQAVEQMKMDYLTI